MNDDQMDSRLDEFAEKWTAEFTEPPVPKPAPGRGSASARRRWLAPISVATTLIAAAAITVVAVTSVPGHRATPATAPPTADQSNGELSSSPNSVAQSVEPSELVPDEARVLPVPDSVDLSFLPPATDENARERLDNALRGKSYTATEISRRTIAGRGVSLRFGVERVEVNAGCNQISVGFTLNGSALRFAEGRSMTFALCAGPIGDQEHWVNEFLSGTVQVTDSANGILIRHGDETMTLVEVREAPHDDVTDQAGGESLTIDEVVTADGSHPLPDLEFVPGWPDTPTLTIFQSYLHFDVGCGSQRTVTSGVGDRRTAGEFDAPADDCPPVRTALADALRYILSGALSIERDGPFITIAGRDGIKVTAHASF